MRSEIETKGKVGSTWTARGTMGLFVNCFCKCTLHCAIIRKPRLGNAGPWPGWCFFLFSLQTCCRTSRWIVHLVPRQVDSHAIWFCCCRRCDLNIFCLSSPLSLPTFEISTLLQGINRLPYLRDLSILHQWASLSEIYRSLTSCLGSSAI